MTQQFDSILRNDPSEIARLHQQLEQAARRADFPERQLHDVQLAVEEHLTNVFRYAFTDAQPHRIRVHVQIDVTGMRIQIADDGPAFNPLERPSPDLSLPPDQRPVGGLGIHMMKNSVDAVDYRRQNGENILMLIKRR